MKNGFDGDQLYDGAESFFAVNAKLLWFAVSKKKILVVW